MKMPAKLSNALICAGALGVTALTALGADSGATPPRAVPTDGAITLTDYGYREWSPELVHYTVGTRFKPGHAVVRAPDGQEIPCQVEDGILSFVAALAKGSSVTYRVAAGNPDPKATALTVQKGKDRIEVGNAFFRLRLPAAGMKTFKAPVDAADAAQVPAPILGWQPAGGTWMGGARFVTDRKISGYAFKVLREGPVCCEVELRYQFVPAGEYVCRARIVNGLDHAEFVEEFDFGAITQGQDFLLLELQKGFAPATLGRCMPGGEAARATTDRKPLAEYLAAKMKDGANPPAPVGGAGVTPMPPRPEPGMVLLEKIVAGGKWGGLIGGIELRAAAPAAAQLPADRVAVAPLHVGGWRRAMALTVWQKPGAGIVVALPISVRHITWYAETTDDISPFSSHEHDAGLKPSYGRRDWALSFAADPAAVQETIGYIGLDNYKNWMLEWPETAKVSDYPRAAFTQADIARLKKNLAQYPDREMLAKYYVVSGNKEHAIAHGQEAADGVVSQMGYLGNWYVGGLSHYRQSQGFARLTPLADDALACPDLPPELRRALRRSLAFGAYMMAEPDLNPRGVGVHLGNNNMSINRTCPLIDLAGLLPDHPQYAYWMERGTAFVRYKLATHNAWDGANLECPTYQLYGPTRFLDEAVTIIHNTGGPDFASYVAANVGYLANLTMPDARVDGRRIIPGMGNSSDMLESIFGVTLNSVERADPKLAARMLALEQQCYTTEPLVNLLNNDGNATFAFNFRPDLVPQNPGLTTTIIPTYGVVFRAHYGSPDETALLLRAGINWGHWDTDPLNTILYGKGAPLSPGTGYQYYYGVGVQDNIIYHNQVKVGAYNKPEIFGRVDGAVQDYGFGAQADYAVASRYYPPEAFDEYKDGQRVRQGEGMSWNRHVLFLKSATPAGANYFLMRDTFPSSTGSTGSPQAGSGQAGSSGRPTWWTWMNLDGPEKVSVDGKAFDPAAVPLNKLVPEAQMPTMTGRTLEMKTAYGASTYFWFTEALPIRARMVWDYPQGGRLRMTSDQFPKLAPKETKTTIEAVAKPGADYNYVVYPHKDAEPVPTCTDLGGGVKVTTTESTDYLFISDTPLHFAKEDVVFTGKAGAVRVFADRVVLCLNAGNGQVGYKGCVFSGPGPFERVVKLADLKAGETAVTDTYEKKAQTADLGRGVAVRGEGPFKAKLDGDTIRLTIDGRARVLFVTRPDWIERPQYWIDGQEWMACWTDYPASGWGTYRDTNLIALSVPGGKHELTLKNLVFPAGWARPFTPTLAGALVPAVSATSR